MRLPVATRPLAKQPLSACQETRCEAKAIGDRVGLRDNGPIDPKAGIADQQFVTDLDVHPVEQERGDDGAIGSIVRGQQFCERLIGSAMRRP